MTEKLRREAINAMTEIMSHPISTLFRDPVVPGDVAPPQYFEIISNPQDLSTIKTQLIDKKYTSVQKWLDDVEAVWANAEQYHGKDTPFAIAAAENRRLWGKIKKNIENSAIGKWCGDVYEYRTQITDIMTQPPSKVKQFTSSLGTARSMKQAQPTLSEKEIHNFILASSQLTTDDDYREMINIITEMQPELETGSQELDVDVSKLNINTINRLKEYIKSKLEKFGLKYPE